MYVCCSSITAILRYTGAMSSKRWLTEHHTDEYVKRAREAGYASRAAFKLLEINEKDHILKTGMTIIDLGAAPGGWSQVAMQKIGRSGQIIAVDLLPMEPVAGVTFIQGDFTEESVLDEITRAAGDKTVDLVMSDMAPNFSGNKSVDQPRSVYLVELALDCAYKLLNKNGSFLAKVFQGDGVDVLLADAKRHFKAVKIRKPKASRARSSEIYILATQFMGYNG